MTRNDSQTDNHSTTRSRASLALGHARRNGRTSASLRRTTETAAVELVPASRFTFEELTQAYNQTRVDYIVPMPMNADRLREYVQNYDVNLDASVVSLEGDQILGLAMLGLRLPGAWITRLGVLPVKRRRRTGQRLMAYLIAYSRRSQVSHVQLEVIKGNIPAHRLFLKLGFRETRELLVIRRPPCLPPDIAQPYNVEFLESEQATELLRRRTSCPSWLDEAPSLINAGQLAALRVELDGGDRGWLVYQESIFQLGRLVPQTTAGDPYQVALALMHALHTRHPAADTKSENLPANDPHWPALQAMGYIESFRRVEMRLDLQ
jgi:ribosomal protein S18 acetylase RimI-like enzyme